MCVPELLLISPQLVVSEDASGRSSLHSSLSDTDSTDPYSPPLSTCQLEILVSLRGLMIYAETTKDKCDNSVLEQQAIVADLIENFEFALPDDAKEMEILRKPTGLMVPMVKDHMELGSWMGLKVTSVR